MRILVSNPDTIGDFVLRQPMFAALREAGHELMLIVRSFVSPITPMVAPGASVVQCELNPYEPEYSPETPAFQAILEQARDFVPDLLVVAPYQRTDLDEDLAERLPGVPTAGMSGYLFPGPLYLGQEKQSRLRLTTEVMVPADAHELRKSELLCSAILRRNVVLPPPCLTPPADLVRMAHNRLASLGLQRQTFWIACVGDNPYTQVKNWRPERWAEVLSGAVRRHGIRLLFVGTPDENEKTETVRAAMGPEASRTVSLCATPDGMDTLVGLIHESAAYIGKDTGPMHIAAALGKPVIAVFGGGGWPRFTPLARTGAVFTVQVPCAGCNYICHLDQSHCIKEVPVAPVLEAVDAVATNRQEVLAIHALQPDDMLVALMIREASAVSRNRLRESNRLARKLESDLQQIRSAHPVAAGQEKQIADLQAAKDWLDGRKVELELAQQQHLREIAALTAAKSEMDRLASRQSAELSAARNEHGQIQLQLGRFQARAEDLERERTFLAARETALSAEVSQWRAQVSSLTEQKGRLEEEISSKDAAAAVLESNHLEYVNNLKMLMADLKEQLARKDREIGSVTDLVRSLKRELDQRIQQESVLRGLESDRAAALEHVGVLQARLQESEEDRAARLVVMKKLESSLLESEEDRAARLILIEELDSQLKDSQADRLSTMRELKSKLQESEADRAARLSSMRELESKLQESEADRAARLSSMRGLESKLQESEADRAARLEHMSRLENLLAESERISTARLETILKLEDRLKALEGRLIYRAAHAVGLI